MQRYEYKVIPAPLKGEKTRGVKGTPGRFAHGLSRIMNDLARDGWEYLRADTLPCEERTGLTGKTVTYQNMLVFRRAVAPALPIFDETTVPGVTVNGASAPGVIPAGRNGGLSETGSVASEAPTAEAGQIKEDGASDAPAKPPLSARAPEGKAPRITAFDRLADALGKDSPVPEGRISKG